MENWENLQLDDLAGEEWREIPNTNGVFFASCFGRIKSKIYYNKKCGRIIKQHSNKQGYLLCNVYINGKYRLCFVHRLISYAFF